MADNSKIEWTDATWNPIRGCSRVSEGCRHCYAEGVAARFSGAEQPYEGLARRVTKPDGSTEARWTGKLVRAPDETLTQPMRWKKPRKIFVNSMSDLFHEAVPDEWIDRIFAVMALSPQHTFQVLTKRPERMRNYMLERWQPAPAHRIEVGGGDAFDSPAETVGEGRRDQVARECEDFIRQFKLDDTEREDLWDEQERLKIMQWAWPLPNVWLGTSCEDQVTADTRIPYLLGTPAAVRFISAEPLLGPIDLRHIDGQLDALAGAVITHVLQTNAAGLPDEGEYYMPIGRKLDWVIVGGESGHGARPMHPWWAGWLHSQCRDAGVSFLFKQWGNWAPVPATEPHTLVWPWAHTGPEDPAGSSGPPPAAMRNVGKHAAGRLLYGVEHNGFPVPRVA